MPFRCVGWNCCGDLSAGKRDAALISETAGLWLSSACPETRPMGLFSRIVTDFCWSACAERFRVMRCAGRTQALFGHQFGEAYFFHGVKEVSLCGRHLNTKCQWQVEFNVNIAQGRKATPVNSIGTVAPAINQLAIGHAQSS